MPDRLSILCVHGIGHGDVDPQLMPSWRNAITADLQRWTPGLQVTFDFFFYDTMFEQSKLNAVTYAEAVAKLAASGISHGSGDLLPGSRGLADIPTQLRWTTGMIAQWASDDGLRERLRAEILKAVAAMRPDIVCAHSMGSLICYDAFQRNPGAISNSTFVTSGSQIGNPFVRDCFAGRIEALDARLWYHLYNPDDRVFTAELRIQAPNFAEIDTPFDKPNDVLNHDPLWYFNHANTQSRVWFDLSGALPARALSRDRRTSRVLQRTPERRALLVGINAYPNPANRLEGCVNDVFLMSSLLQECGFKPEEIRVVLDDRATTANILDRLHWLLDDVQPDDERVLFYSGHGAQIPAYGAHQEVDRLNECLVPWDFDWSLEHAITDKQFVSFYSQLPYDSHFAAIFDCCHSGGLTREGGLRPRGIDPPDDIRHRALRWNLELGMWQERSMPSPNRSLARSREGKKFLGDNGVTYRMGRAVSLRTLPNRVYNREREELGHKGPYLPIILEACQEAQLSYEYRDGATSYGAFTFSLAKVLRESRTRERNPNFQTLVASTANRLEILGYDQTPSLVGPKRLLRRPVPWVKPRARSRRAVSRS
jgi:metacaspase-1